VASRSETGTGRYGGGPGGRFELGALAGDDTGDTHQVLSAISGTNAQESAAGSRPRSPLCVSSQAAKVARGNATNTVTAGPWPWGRTESTAPSTEAS